MTPIPVYVTDCVGDCLVIAHAAEDMARVGLVSGVVAAVLVIFAAFLVAAAVMFRS